MSILIGSLQEPPESTTAFPDESTPTQNLADAHEIQFSPDVLSVCTTGHCVLVVDRSTLPPLSTAKHCVADRQDNPERVSPSLVKACWSMGVGLVHPAGPTVTPVGAVVGLDDGLPVDVGDTGGLVVVCPAVGWDVGEVPDARGGALLW